MKVIGNYNNFDIKQLKNGCFRVYADRDLKEYAGNVKWKKSATEEYEKIDDAISSIDRYWKARK